VRKPRPGYSFYFGEFWITRDMKFIADGYRYGKFYRVMFYSDPYPYKCFSQQYVRWNNQTDAGFKSTNDTDISSMEKTYRYVKDLPVCIYNDEQMDLELHKPSRHFVNIYKLTIRFEQTVSPCVFSNYMKKTINLELINKLTLSMIPATRSRGILQERCGKVTGSCRKTPEIAGKWKQYSG
jgi:hypothetical protein